MVNEQEEHFGKWTLVLHTIKSYENAWFATLLFRNLLLYAKKHHHLLKVFSPKCERIEHIWTSRESERKLATYDQFQENQDDISRKPSSCRNLYNINYREGRGEQSKLR